MKLPGPDHPITITANPKRIRVSAGGVVIADTTHALTLKEASYPAVQYVPRSDANMALLARTERTTHCPYKGDANYFSINTNGKTLENAIWTYENPLPAAAKIAGYLAFDTTRVDLLEFVMAQLLRIYDRQTARDWLFGLNPNLGDRRPLDLIRAGRVHDVIAAVEAEYGDAYA